MGIGGKLGSTAVVQVEINIGIRIALQTRILGIKGVLDWTSIWKNKRIADQFN